jgi:hypothetical protein
MYKVLFGITLKGVSKKAIIPVLTKMRYSVVSETKTLGEKDINPNYIMCEKIFFDVTDIGHFMNTLYDFHKGIIRIIPVHIELLDTPRSISGRKLLQ